MNNVFTLQCKQQIVFIEHLCGVFRHKQSAEMKRMQVGALPVVFSINVETKEFHLMYIENVPISSNCLWGVCGIQ